MIPRRPSSEVPRTWRCSCGVSARPAACRVCSVSERLPCSIRASSASTSWRASGEGLPVLERYNHAAIVSRGFSGITPRALGGRAPVSPTGRIRCKDGSSSRTCSNNIWSCKGSSGFWSARAIKSSNMSGLVVSGIGATPASTSASASGSVKRAISASAACKSAVCPVGAPSRSVGSPSLRIAIASSMSLTNSRFRVCTAAARC